MSGAATWVSRIKVARGLQEQKTQYKGLELIVSYFIRNANWRSLFLNTILLLIFSWLLFLVGVVTLLSLPSPFWSFFLDQPRFPPWGLWASWVFLPSSKMNAQTCGRVMKIQSLYPVKHTWHFLERSLKKIRDWSRWNKVTQPPNCPWESIFPLI